MPAEKSERPLVAKLVATRLPPALATKVERAAKSEMISTAAFVRRAIASAVLEPKRQRGNRQEAEVDQKEKARILARARFLLLPPEIRKLRLARARRIRARARRAIAKVNRCPRPPVAAVEKKPSRYSAREKAEILARARRLIAS